MLRCYKLNPDTGETKQTEAAAVLLHNSVSASGTCHTSTPEGWLYQQDVQQTEFSLFAGAGACCPSQTGSDSLHSLHLRGQWKLECRRREERKFTINCLVQRIDLSPFYRALGIWTTTCNKRSLNVSWRTEKVLRKKYQMVPFPFHARRHWPDLGNADEWYPLRV